MKLFKKYLLPNLKQYKWLMISTIGLGTLTFITASMLTFTSGYLITRASEMPYNILLLYVPIVGVRFFGISRPVVHYLERLTGHNTVLKILADMRVKLYDVLEPQALFIRSRFQTGDLLGTLADDIEHLQDAYIRTIFPTVVGICLFLYSVVVLAIFDWVFALWIAFCLCIILIVYPLISLYLLKKRQVKLKAERKEMYRSLTDAVFGITDWMISGKKDKFIMSFSNRWKESSVIDKKMAYWNHSRTFQLQILVGLILIMVGIWASLAAGRGDILPTYIASFTLVTLPILEGMIPVSNAIEKIPTYQESLQRLEDIERFGSNELAGGVANGNDDLLHEIELSDTPLIELKNAVYSYPNEQIPALKGINLKIPFGQKVAILGKSGAGKSTLMQLLYGSLQADKGSVKIGEHEPYEYGEQIHDVLSILNQKPYLFATSVENNIRLGKQDATREEIVDVLKQVNLDQYIASLPNGLETQMEETGQRFSGGERQRIALARILLKNNPVVLLDEPTIGLDPMTEADLLDTIFKTLKDKTVILITHHLLGLEKMDKIIFLDKGEIVMEGTHAELMATNERYRQLYTLDRGLY